MKRRREERKKRQVNKLRGGEEGRVMREKQGEERQIGRKFKKKIEREEGGSRKRCR